MRGVCGNAHVLLQLQTAPSSVEVLAGHPLLGARVPIAGLRNPTQVPVRDRPLAEHRVRQLPPFLEELFDLRRNDGEQMLAAGEIVVGMHR